jgi:hypothetical protein
MGPWICAGAGEARTPKKKKKNLDLVAAGLRDAWGVG